jgi:hypothetical protein
MLSSVLQKTQGDDSSELLLYSAILNKVQVFLPQKQWAPQMPFCHPQRNMNKPACSGETSCNEFLKPFGVRADRRLEPLSTRG